MDDINKREMSTTIISTFEDASKKRMGGFDRMDQPKFGIEKRLKMPTSEFINDTHEPTAAVNPTRTYNMMIDIPSLGPSSAKCLNSRQLMFIMKAKRTSAFFMVDLPTAIYRLRRSYEDRFMKSRDPNYRVETQPNDAFETIDKFNEQFTFIGVIYASATPSGQYGVHPEENYAPIMTYLPVPMSISASCFFPNIIEDSERTVTAGKPIYMMFRLVHKDHARPLVAPDGTVLFSNLTSEKNSGVWGVPDVVFTTETPLLVDTTMKTSKYRDIQTYINCACYDQWKEFPMTDAEKRDLQAARIANPTTEAPGYYEMKYTNITKVGNLQHSYHKTKKPFMRQRLTPYELLKYDPMEVALDIQNVNY